MKFFVYLLILIWFSLFGYMIFRKVNAPQNTNEIELISEAINQTDSIPLTSVDLFEKNVGGNYTDVPMCIIETKDYGYAICG